VQVGKDTSEEGKIELDLGIRDVPVHEVGGGGSIFEDYLGDSFEKVDEINLEEGPQTPVEPVPSVSSVETLTSDEPRKKRVKTLAGRTSLPWVRWPSGPKPLLLLANPLPKPNSHPNHPANLTGWLLKGLSGGVAPPNRGLRWLRKSSPHRKALPSRIQKHPLDHKPHLFLRVNTPLLKPAIYLSKHLLLSLFLNERLLPNIAL